MLCVHRLLACSSSVKDSAVAFRVMVKGSAATFVIDKLGIEAPLLVGCCPTVVSGSARNVRLAAPPAVDSERHIGMPWLVVVVLTGDGPAKYFGLPRV